MPESLYRYIWRVGRRRQLLLVVLTALVFPLSMAPLEIQRRIIDQAIGNSDLKLLLILGGAYLGYMVVNGGLKFLMNMQRARIAQSASAHLRESVYHCIYAGGPAGSGRRGQEAEVDEGSVVSMLSAETERLGQFIGGSLSIPILQIGTMSAVLGYMIWVEPLIALIGLAVYTPQMVIVPLMQGRINDHNQVYAERVRELGDFVVDRAGQDAGERDVPEPFRGIVGRMFEAKMTALRLKFLMKFLRNSINHFGPLSILMVGGWFVIQGRTELGTIVAFLSGFEKISGPWSELIAFYRQVSNARMKYRLLIDAFPERGEDAGPLPAPRFA